MPRKKKDEAIDQSSDVQAVDPKAEYRKVMTEEFSKYTRAELVIEKERLFDTIRTRAGSATWPVQTRYEIVCELLKGLGVA